MNITVILPSLNPDEKLIQVVEGLLKEGFKDIIIVNDGSDEEHMGPFEEAKKHPEVTVLTHEVNKGKGRGLKTAYEFCIANRPDIDGVVTVDGDNQHRPVDIKACCEKLMEDTDKVVLGCRSFKGDDVPWKSSFGNNATRLVFRLLCRIKITDTQTGLRAIPAKYLEFMDNIQGERFEYETRVLLEMKKAGIEFIEVPIETVYIEENATTHFHPVKDSIKIYKVIFRFAFGRMVQFFKFMLGSIMSFLIDNGIFTLLGHLLTGYMDDKWRIFTATAAARVISSMFNFIINRKAVFKSHNSVGITLAKYYSLCIVQMGLSAGLVYLFAEILNVSGLWESLVKIVVDIALFLASYQIQKRWVFADKLKEN